MNLRSIGHYCFLCRVNSDEQLEGEGKGHLADGRIYDPQAASDAFRQGERILFNPRIEDVENFSYADLDSLFKEAALAALREDLNCTRVEYRHF